VKFLFVLLMAAILLFGALGDYIGGRILLPAMGLTAPGYWTWFWFMVVVLSFVTLIKFLSSLVDE
jgi:hypothetical protein